ncbi:MAG: four helix bundle protein [Bacteroidetes bacterium]|nr:four helix bundle protein [Bacteroidota bacterium]
MNDTYEFETLEVWKKTREFRKAISQLTKKFPPCEQYELTKQIKISSRSVTANIAEGNGRYHYKDNSRFIRISTGSLKETMDHLYVAFDEEYIKEDELKFFKSDYLHCKKLLNGYLAYLKKNIK